MLVLLALLLSPALPSAAAAADGDLDKTFLSPTIRKSRVIRGKVNYPDGKFLIYGFFTSTGQLRTSIARMNSDGTTDTSFYTPNLSGEVRSIHLLASGQVFIAGNFSLKIGSTNDYYYNFARLNTDGTLDTTFPKVFNQSGAVNEIAVRSDGKFLLGGYSLSVIASPANTFHLVRLNGDGSLDGSYPNRAAPGGYVSAVKLLTGDGARVFGTLPRGDGHVDYWLDLNSAGVVQTNLGDETVDGPILGVGTQSIIPNNGKLVICGQFQHVLGAARSRVARFNTDMTLDTSFHIGSGANEMVSGLIVQGDDKIVMAGDFDAFNGAAAGYLARLTPDGLTPEGGLDPTFNAGTGADSRIVSLTPGPGGSGLMIHGYFENYKNNHSYGIAGLDDNGNLLSPYVTYVIANYPGYVYALVAQSDGKILVGGDFTRVWQSGTPVLFQDFGGIARLNPDGTLDASFKGGVDGYVDSIAVQPDGKILLAGKFGAAKGYARTSLARLNPDGSLDTTFNPLLVKGDGSVSDLHQVLLLSGGQLMAAGDFAAVNGANRGIAARLNGDGSLDAAFNAQFDRSGVSNGVGYRVAQAAGKYVVGGSLVLSGFESDGPQGFLARFTNTGALDLSFGPAASPTPVPNANILQVYKAAFPRGPVSDMFLQPDGKIVVSGGFYQIMDGSSSPPPRDGSVRFSGSGFLDNTYIPAVGSRPAAMALQPNGKILLSGLVRLNPDGTLDSTFNADSWDWQVTGVYAILRQASGKAIVGGDIWMTYGPPTYRATSLPRVFAGPPNYSPGTMLLLLLE
jgi:uncharacterized delta-60 repeat protein